MDFEKYEEDCKTIRRTNDMLLELFKQDLIQNGLKDRTINRHLSNVDFYINTYLLREDANPMENGTWMIDGFLGDFFIRKCMWSTPGNIKSTAASIKKIYKSMLEYEKLQKEDYDYLCSEIRDNMEIWQENCAIFNDPHSPSPFRFFE